MTAGDTADSRCSTPSNSAFDDSTTGGGRRPRGRRQPKRKRSRGPGRQRPNFDYQYTCHVQEDHNKQLFSLQINPYVEQLGKIVFAAAGSNRITVYEATNGDDGGDINLLQVYADPDEDEIFYTVAWSYDKENGRPLLAAAGHRGIVRVIPLAEHYHSRNITGHGQAINELKFIPNEPNMLVSASKDHSVRLWNIKTGVCVAIFGGAEGHRDEVLSVDLTFDGDKMITSGMDHSLMIWRLDKDYIEDAIAASYKFCASRSRRAFPTVCEHFPDWTTRNVHRNYIDCVLWFGRMVLSKSTENNIILWQPGKIGSEEKEINRNDDCSIVRKFGLQGCDIWFVKFTFEYNRKLLAVGNKVGKVFVWDLDVPHPGKAPKLVLSHAKCTKAIRQIAMSRNGSVMLYSCDDGSIWRWDQVNVN
ncbi:WD domain, G-beta repeat [Nesidiocoris tenuis]|uniref:WD domain, G-beta repeat n=1 Tax=Nesidiocoris tenuis TaxID=355587 RepID=A0ABN7ALD0_9HEMI|nr:WD domain, G-beta repeat [Nesidiocoris tenuis]